MGGVPGGIVDLDMDLECKCFLFASEGEEGGAGKKRKRVGAPAEVGAFVPLRYPIHLYECKEADRRAVEGGDEFEEACDGVRRWRGQDPEEWKFKEFNPDIDSDDEDVPIEAVQPVVVMPPPVAPKKKVSCFYFFIFHFSLLFLYFFIFLFLFFFISLFFSLFLHENII